MTVYRAQKLQYLKETPLRGLREAGAEAGKDFLYLKDVFELGAYSQLYVGHACRRAARLQVRQRIAVALGRWPSPPYCHIEEEHGECPRALAPAKRPGKRRAGWVAQAIQEEIDAVHACKSPFAKQTVILATEREGVSGASKYFYVMPPAPHRSAGVRPCPRTTKSADAAQRGADGPATAGRATARHAYGAGTCAPRCSLREHSLQCRAVGRHRSALVGFRPRHQGRCGTHYALGAQRHAPSGQGLRDASGARFCAETWKTPSWRSHNIPSQGAFPDLAPLLGGLLDARAQNTDGAPSRSCTTLTCTGP